MTRLVTGVWMVAATAALLWCAACGGDGQENLAVNTLGSACGGFDAPTLKDDLDSYCGDSVLSWTYDAGTGVLHLLDENAWLNCCGNHDVSISATEDGGYRMVERDRPEAHGSRCSCMCLFDFSADLPNLSGGQIPFTLSRNVTDNDPAWRQVWQGTLDLDQGQGRVVIQESVGWCDMY